MTSQRKFSTERTIAGFAIHRFDAVRSECANRDNVGMEQPGTNFYAFIDDTKLDFPEDYTHDTVGRRDKRTR